VIRKKNEKKKEVKAGSLKEVISSEFQTDTTEKIFFHTQYLEAYTPVIFCCKCQGYKRLVKTHRRQGGVELEIFDFLHIFY
jgi:hypothetical protein